MTLFRRRIIGLVPLALAALFAAFAAQNNTTSFDQIDERAQRDRSRIQSLEDYARETSRNSVLIEGRIARVEANIENLKASVDRIDSTLTQVLLGIAALFVSQAVQFFARKGGSG